MADEQIQVKLNPDTMPSGSDLAVVNAARKSFNSRSDWEYAPIIFKLDDGSEADYGKILSTPTLKEKDKRLLEFLARGMTVKDFEDFLEGVKDAVHRSTSFYDFEELIEPLYKWRKTPEHDTPFNHCFVSFEVKAPIFVARQLVKHEYLVWSEASGRYIENTEFYRPSIWREAPEDKKQGSGGPAKAQYHPNTYIQEVEEFVMERFKKMVSEGQNIAMEQARMILPQNMMVEWTWSGSLGAFCKMCSLRLASDAQYETRLVARQVYEYLKEYYPVSAKCLVEGPDV